MTEYLFTNNASALLAVAIGAGDTVLQVDPGDGALFPSPGAGEQSILALENDAGDLEYVLLTSRTGDNLTVTRAQEGTLAQAFGIGTRVENRLSAGTLGFVVQKDAVVNQIRGSNPTDAPITWSANHPQIDGSDIFTFADLPTITPYSETLLDDLDSNEWLTTLGGTATGVGVFEAVDADAALAVLGTGTAAVENVQAVGVGDLLREDGDGTLLTNLLVPDGILGCKLTAGTDTDHDFDVSTGFVRDAADAETMQITAAFGKQLDQYVAPGGTPASPTGALAVADDYAGASDLTFIAATSRITSVSGRFANADVGDTVVFRDTTSNNLGFTITVKTSNNDVTVSSAPTDETPAAATMQIIKADAFLYVFLVFDGAAQFIAVDTSNTATNALAHLSATQYALIGYIIVRADNSNILGLVSASAGYAELEYDDVLSGSTIYEIPWAEYYSVEWVAGGGGGWSSGAGFQDGGGGGGPGGFGELLLSRQTLLPYFNTPVTVGSGGNPGSNGQSTIWALWTASGGQVGTANGGGLSGVFGKTADSGKTFYTQLVGQGGADSGADGRGHPIGPGGGGGGAANTFPPGIGGLSGKYGSGGNGRGNIAGTPGDYPGGGGGGASDLQTGATAGASGMFRIRAFRGNNEKLAA